MVTIAPDKVYKCVCLEPMMSSATAPGANTVVIAATAHGAMAACAILNVKDREDIICCLYPTAAVLSVREGKT